MYESKSLINALNQSTNSVNQMRSGLFLPFGKVKNTNIYKEFYENKGCYMLSENSHYILEVYDHLLSQIHRDILDILFSRGNLKPLLGDKAYVHFTLNSLLSALSLNNGKTDYVWLVERLEELKRANFKLISKDGLFSNTMMFSICDIVSYSELLNMYILVFSKSYLTLLANDILINYNHYLPNLLNIKNHKIKAFIRFVISNDWRNQLLEDVIIELGFSEKNTSKRQLQKIKKDILGYDYSKFGISINKGYVRYQKRDDIYFHTTNKSSKRTNVPNQKYKNPDICEPISRTKRTNIPIKNIPP